MIQKSCRKERAITTSTQPLGHSRRKEEVHDEGGNCGFWEDC